MDPHHRKVDLQSPADLLYLQSNIQAAAQQKLDLAIPPQGEDAFRTKVQELVHEYISQTLNIALPSLSVNGLDASPSLLAPIGDPSATDKEDPPSTPPEGDTNYEAYDPRLGAKLRDLYAQLEQESTRVAELRRDAPGAAARAYMERLEAELEAERVLERERGKDGVAVGGDVSLLEGVKVENLEEVERMWGRGVGGLAGLEKITGVLAKLERAATAAEVVEGI